jgi:hypothetical protein
MRSALDPRLLSLDPQWTHRELHPDFRLAMPVSSCWTMSPVFVNCREAEAVGLEPTTGVTRTCFRDRPLIRPDDFRSSRELRVQSQSRNDWRRVLVVRLWTLDPRLLTELRELESNQRPPGSEPGVTTSSNCPASSS